VEGIYYSSIHKKDDTTVYNNYGRISHLIIDYEIYTTYFWTG
jgi:hypothetical protein